MVYFILGRILRPAAKLGFYIYNHLFKVPRARAVVRNELGEVLLLRSWIGTLAWSLPGGGVNHKEDTKMAAKRELYEETGIDAPLEDFTYITTSYISGYPQPVFEVMVKKAQLPAKRYNKLEITYIDWFSLDKLPKITPLAEVMLEKVAPKS